MEQNIDNSPSFINFILNLNNDLKDLCLIKIKLIQGDDLSEKYCEAKKLITDKLNDLLEMLDNAKDFIPDGLYLSELNQAKIMYDLMNHIDKLQNKD